MLQRPLYILLVEKEGRIWSDMICLKLYQFERINPTDIFRRPTSLSNVSKFHEMHLLFTSRTQEVGAFASKWDLGRSVNVSTLR